MKKIVFIILGFTLASYILGCGRKQQPLEEMQQPISMENLATISTTSSAPADQRVFEPKVEMVNVAKPAQTVSLEPVLPPAGPYKPTSNEIQTALKNAGFYTGDVDGKIGPMTKKAIEDFQKAKGLKVDGKVGPKTWEVLSAYLTVSSKPSKKR